MTLINKIKNIFKKKVFVPAKPYWQILQEIDKNNAVWQQEFEDMRIKQDIYRTAHDAFSQFLENKSKGRGCGIVIYNPSYIKNYTIHDEATAKYKHLKFKDLIDIEFKKLTDKYEHENELLERRYNKVQQEEIPLHSF